VYHAAYQIDDGVVGHVWADDPADPGPANGFYLGLFPSRKQAVAAINAEAERIVGRPAYVIFE
jgi:hypothetical protein